MADVFSKRKRSEIMSRIRARGNRDTELRLIRIFRTYGITGWRRGSKLPGKPDFVFLKLKLAVFVDGCFWHGCPKHGTKPKTNATFWRMKISRNMVRDRRINQVLRAMGWTVMRIWEHELMRVGSPRLLRKLAVLISTRVPCTLGPGQANDVRPRLLTNCSGAMDSQSIGRFIPFAKDVK